MNALRTNHVLVLVIAGLFVITAGAVILVNIWQGRRERAAGRASFCPEKTGAADFRQAEPALVRTIREKNPAFDADAFKRQVVSVCRQLGQAGSMEEAEAMSALLTDSMLDSIRTMRTDMQNQAASDMWVKEQIRELVLADYEVQDDGEQIILCLMAALSDRGQQSDEKEHLFKIVMRKECAPQPGGAPEWLLAGFAPWPVRADKREI
ncbi:MAG: hypothetical protein HFE78_05865 [Clostridiales bacterium]|nr:hypothetical protein [Clostridiales bacterium]